ncbi:MAG: IS630 family transposase [Peptococcaceae bacterium]|nr:IS630 family transposase [Peptococcaceae bacterium]
MGSKYNAKDLKEADIEKLEAITKMRTASAQMVRRAKILLLSSKGMSNIDIAAKLDINRNSVQLCLEKYCESGIESALKDDRGRGRKSIITDQDKMYVINIACQKPVELGFAQELWTLRLLRCYVQNHCEDAGFGHLKTIAKSTINNILNEAEIKPHNIKYYLERRDAEFDQKMKDVLIVYKQIEIDFENGTEPANVVISYDEKPGIQAIANTVDDLAPTPEQGYIGRDYEYKRLGTVSLLAGLDLRSGEVIPLVRDTHKSSDFVDFLKMLDEKYDKRLKIRIILDNHSAHTSKETRRYLEQHMGRYEFIFTPKHGSWLNMIESFFGKMTRVFLRGIRVKTKKELEERIYKYFEEVNEEPVVYRWTYKMDEMDEPLEGITESNIA